MIGAYGVVGVNAARFGVPVGLALGGGVELLFSPNAMAFALGARRGMV